jgi:hypothetical protein
MVLLDLLIGAAVAVVVFGLLVSALHAMTAAAASRHAVVLARTQTEQLLERMRSEAESAWSLWVPPNDMNGASNANGHELDLETQDATRVTYHWLYLYDAKAQTVTRYTVAAGVAQAGAVATQITAFAATAFLANAVSTASSAIYDPLFAIAVVTPVAYALADGSVAGNGFVQVTIGGADTLRSELLATAVAPTQFTVMVKYTPQP